MAKLSANGTEVARFVRKRKRNDLPTLRDTTYISVRSNGKVMRKYVSVIHDLYRPVGYRLVTKGWRHWCRVDNAGQRATLDASLKSAGFETVLDLTGTCE